MVDYDQRNRKTMDGVTNPVPSYTPISVKPVAGPALNPPAPVQPAAAPAATPAAPSVAAPTCVPDFSSGIAGSFVLDWRDPATDQVIDQVPMRTALPEFAEAETAALVGKLVDTNA